MSDGSGVIDVGSNSAPVVVDWNEDGLLDLLIANETTNQSIRLYLNSGTTTNPVITSYTYLESGGSGIYWNRCCPQVYDMNGDGKKDLILGENGAKIVYYENVGTNAAPVFDGYEYVQYGNVNIDLYAGTRLSVCDWFEDGLPDLIVSDFDGYVYGFMANSVGIAEETSGIVSSSFSIVPAINPAQGAFNVRLTGAQSNAEITIYDSTGRSVAGTSSANELITIDAGSLPTGVYTVVAANGGSIASCRMVLTH